MAKTTFSTGTILPSAFLNGAKNIAFDDQDKDWHYPRLQIDSFVLTGTNGLDSRYVTLGTEQIISGNKEFSSKVTFNGSTLNVPVSPSTNAKWNNDINNLANEDLITKSVLTSLFGNLQLNTLNDVNCNPTEDDVLLQYDINTGIWGCTEIIDGGSY